MTIAQAREKSLKAPYYRHCPDCGTNFSFTSRFCPTCRKPTHTKTIKRSWPENLVHCRENCGICTLFEKSPDVRGPKCLKHGALEGKKFPYSDCRNCACRNCCFETFMEKADPDAFRKAIENGKTTEHYEKYSADVKNRALEVLKKPQISTPEGVGFDKYDKNAI